MTPHLTRTPRLALLPTLLLALAGCGGGGDAQAPAAPPAPAPAPAPPPVAAPGLPITRAAETLLWFGPRASPLRLAMHDGAGRVLVFSDDDRLGHAYALQLPSGERLVVQAAASGPGRGGEALVFKGLGLRVLSWNADGRPSSVRVVGSQGSVLDLSLPPSLQVVEGAPDRRAQSTPSVTDPCPPLQPGDENWDTPAAEQRSLEHTGCKVGIDPLLRGHPTLGLGASALDWIAQQAERVSPGALRILRDELSAAAAQAQQLLSTLRARFQQAGERARQAASQMADTLLLHGIRYSEQLLPPGSLEQQLQTLESDLRRFRPDEAPASLQNIDPDRLVPPSPAYRPAPAPPLPGPAPQPAPTPPTPPPPPPVPPPAQQVLPPGPSARFTPGQDLPDLGSVSCVLRTVTHSESRLEYCEMADTRWHGWSRSYRWNELEKSMRLSEQTYRHLGQRIETAFLTWYLPRAQEHVESYERLDAQRQTVYRFDRHKAEPFWIQHERFESRATLTTTYFSYCASGELASIVVTTPGQPDQRTTLKQGC